MAEHQNTLNSQFASYSPSLDDRFKYIIKQKKEERQAEAKKKKATSDQSHQKNGESKLHDQQQDNQYQTEKIEESLISSSAQQNIAKFCEVHDGQEVCVTPHQIMQTMLENIALKHDMQTLAQIVLSVQKQALIHTNNPTHLTPESQEVLRMCTIYMNALDLYNKSAVNLSGNDTLIHSDDLHLIN